MREPFCGILTPCSLQPTDQLAMFPWATGIRVANRRRTDDVTELGLETMMRSMLQLTVMSVRTATALMTVDMCH
jgi:hypothetical protein